MLKGFFQLFELDEKRMIDELNKMSEEERSRLNLWKKGETLISSLHGISGYHVLVDTSTCCGLPTSLIVIGEKSDPIKDDFGRIVEELGIRWFKSGKVYNLVLS